MIAACVSMVSCTKDCDDDANISQNSLSSMATSQEGFVMIRATKGDNGGQWNIKMNDVAARAYAEGCRNFPMNSMIVKEKRDAEGNVAGYGVMYRTSGDALASSDGWIYSELNEDGELIPLPDNKSTSCQSCHRQTKVSIH